MLGMLTRRWRRERGVGDVTEALHIEEEAHCYAVRCICVESLVYGLVLYAWMYSICPIISLGGTVHA